MNITLPEIPEAFVVKKKRAGEYNVKLKRSFTHLWNVDIDIKTRHGWLYFESFAQSKAGKTARLDSSVYAASRFTDGGEIGHDHFCPYFCVYWISDPDQFIEVLSAFFCDLWLSIIPDIEKDELSNLRKRVAELEAELENLTECTRVEIKELKQQ